MIPIRPPLAMALGLFLPGAGHVYAGWPRRAVFFAAALPVSLVALCVGTALEIVPVAVFVPLACLVPVTIQIAASIDAFRKAHSPVLAPHRISNRAVVVGFALASLAATTFTGAVLERTTISARRMSSATMTPTLLVGDYVVLRRPPFMSEPEPGDVLEFPFPRDPRFVYLQRVVATNGARVEMTSGEAPSVTGEGWAWTSREPVRWVSADCTLQDGTMAVEVDGEASHRVLLSTEAADPVDVELREGELFVVNDNRGYRSDSRKWGPLDGSEVTGQVLGIVFSWDPCAGRARIDRVGGLRR